MANVLYQGAVCTLHLEHLDIAYGIQMLSKFLKSPEEAHWGAVKRVLLP